MLQLNRIVLTATTTALAAALAACSGTEGTAQAATPSTSGSNQQALDPELIAQGKRIFRYDTFGDSRLWTDQLRMHEVVQVLPPTAALGVGLKVDSAAVPPEVLANADLGDPATTIALLRLDAVVGIRAFVDKRGRIQRLGVTCALCHSTVDDSVAPGIGRRLDGWPNSDLNPGAIIALSPAVPGASQARLQQLGRRQVRPALQHRRQEHAARAAAGVWADARQERDLHGRRARSRTGTRTSRSRRWADRACSSTGAWASTSGARPIASRRSCRALREYQFSLRTPPPPPGSFDKHAAWRGKHVFDEELHGVPRRRDRHRQQRRHPARASRNRHGRRVRRTHDNKAYRTTPLRGLWQHPPYFHDGSAATLDDVVAHYNDVLRLGLTRQQRADLAEYLKTL